MSFYGNYWIVLIFVSLVNYTSAELKYQLLSVLVRHGDRTPLSHGYEQFPTNPYHDSNFEPFGIAQLTDVGKRRAYGVGLNIREKYGDFLGDIYDPKELITRSTNTDRTKMSLKLALLAIYPDSDPDSFQIAYAENADILLNPEGCSQFLEELIRVENLPEVKYKVSKYADLMKKLSKWTGKQLDGTKDIAAIYSYLTSLQSLGLELPEWTSEVFPGEELLNATLLHFETYSTGSPRLKMLNGGVLLKNITETMLSVANQNGGADLKMAMYAAHEYNIFALLNALGVYKPHFPYYSNAILIELLTNDDDDNNYYVRLHYYLGESGETLDLDIPGCEDPCSLDDFFDLYKAIFPTEEDMVC